MPTDEEKREMREMAEALRGLGYGPKEAAQLVWDGYCGGMRGARAVGRVRTEVEDVGAKDIQF